MDMENTLRPNLFIVGISKKELYRARGSSNILQGNTTKDNSLTA